MNEKIELNRFKEFKLFL